MNRRYIRYMAIFWTTLLILPLLMRPSWQTVNGMGTASTGQHIMGYGVQLAALDHVDGRSTQYNVQAMGFNWFKSQLAWSSTQTVAGGTYNWGNADNIINMAKSTNMNLLLRLDSAPGWAAGEGQPVGAAHIADWGKFSGAVAAHMKPLKPAGKQLIYEIWNEPNLQGEWGGTPNASRFAELVRAAYTAIKAADPSALVITGGLATVGGDMSLCAINGNTAIGDLCFMQQMYTAGINGYHDGVGTHPYGFVYAPEQDPAPGDVYGHAFRRAEQQHALMLANNDGGPMYATEFGWLTDPGSGCYSFGDWSTRTWQIVNEVTQADYLVRAYNYAYTNWPWMAGMFVFNLDFGADLYQGCPTFGGNMCQPQRYYSLTYRANPCDPANSQILPHAAWTSLRNMAKPGIAVVDTTPPPAPGKPALSSPANATYVSISWGAVSDPSGIGSYLVEYSTNSGSSWQMVTSTSNTSTLYAGIAGTGYIFRVTAIDGAGNIGAPSAGSNGWICGNGGRLARVMLPTALRNYQLSGW